MNFMSTNERMKINIILSVSDLLSTKYLKYLFKKQTKITEIKTITLPFLFGVLYFLK